MQNFKATLSPKQPPPPKPVSSSQTIFSVFLNPLPSEGIAAVAVAAEPANSAEKHSDFKHISKSSFANHQRQDDLFPHAADKDRVAVEDRVKGGGGRVESQEQKIYDLLPSEIRIMGAGDLGWVLVWRDQHVASEADEIKDKEVVEEEEEERDTSTLQAEYLWPCVVVSSRKRKCGDGDRVGGDSSSLAQEDVRVSPNAGLLNNRLDAFQADRVDYLVKLLPFSQSLQVDTSCVWPQNMDELPCLSSNRQSSIFPTASVLSATKSSSRETRRSSELARVVVVPDFFVLPYSYTTDAVPPPKRKSNEQSRKGGLDLEVLLVRALVQAVYIQSTWAVPNDESESGDSLARYLFLRFLAILVAPLLNFHILNMCSSETNPIDCSIEEAITISDPILPIWNKPIRMNCPTLKDTYSGAKIPQSLMEPKLVAKAGGMGVGVVDLTSELVKQGVSHWKNSRGKVSFFLNAGGGGGRNVNGSTKSASTINAPPFPKTASFEKVRLGPFIIKVGDCIVIDSPAESLDEAFVLRVVAISVPKGLLTFTGYSLHDLAQQSAQHRQEMDGSGTGSTGISSLLKLKTCEASRVKGRFTGVFDEGWRLSDHRKIGYERCNWDGTRISTYERRIII